MPTWKLKLSADLRRLVAEATTAGDLDGDLVRLADHQETVDVDLTAAELDALHLVATRHIAHGTWDPITAATCANAIERLQTTRPTGTRSTEPPPPPPPRMTQRTLI